VKLKRLKFNNLKFLSNVLVLAVNLWSRAGFGSIESFENIYFLNSAAEATTQAPTTTG
jgi:hypothetical protein